MALDVRSTSRLVNNPIGRTTLSSLPHSDAVTREKRENNNRNSTAPPQLNMIFLDCERVLDYSSEAPSAGSSIYN